MSTKTLRKRISLVAVTALTAGVISAVAAPVANANIYRATNSVATDNVMGVATEGTSGNDTGAAVFSSVAEASNIAALKSHGLLYKDPTSATAQTATMLSSGTLVLYTLASSTAVSFVASGGSFTGGLATSASTNGTTAANLSFGTDLRSVVSGDAATTVAVRWSPGGVAGTYTITSYETDDVTFGGGTTNRVRAAAPTTGLLRGSITVTVLAASAGGSYSAANSACNTNATAATATGTDSTATKINGESWFVNFSLADAYAVALPAGVISITATNSALLALGTAGSTAAKGTAPQVVSAAASSGSVRIDQPVANAPVTTTVAISYNGSVVCTKTVTIRGQVEKISVTTLGTQDLNATTTEGNAALLGDGSGRIAMFTVLATDSAGNQVATPTSLGTYAQVASTITSTVTGIALADANLATATSSTSIYRYSTGIWSCGPTAGSSKVKIQYTNLGSGKVITSDEFTASCADDPYSYTASFDKATYTQGEIATLTVQFRDSKGNAANSVDAPGAAINILPMMTFVTATGSASTLANDKGQIVYTLTVGTTTGMTAGTYTGIVDFTTLTGNATAVKATPTYKLVASTTDVAFSEVLKSVVALIASINKQIQALQKLIVNRKR